jgi:hypothetical protein
MDLKTFLEERGQAPIKGKREFLPPFYPGMGPVRNLVWLTGASQSGKTTAALYADAVPTGAKPNTLYIDMEYSVPNHGDYGVHVVNVLPKYATEVIGGNDIYLPMFTAFLEFMELVKAGEYDDYRTIVIDPVEGLFNGANLWVRKHPSMFAKPERAFTGREGTIFSWGATKDLWNRICNSLLDHFENVILISHVSARYSGNTEVGQKPRGPSFTEVATLHLWTHAPGWPEPGIPKNAWGVEIVKSRFQKMAMPSVAALIEDGTIETLVRHGVIDESEVESLKPDDERLSPFMGPRPIKLLPAKFFVPPGQALFDVIRKMLIDPKEDWGELEVVHHPGSELKLDDEERLRIEAAKAVAILEAEQIRAQRDLVREKKNMLRRLVKAGYKDAAEVAVALKEIGVELTLDNIDEVEATLLEMKNGQQA